MVKTNSCSTSKCYFAKCYFTSSAVSDDVEVASDNPSLITPTTTTPVLVKAKVQEALKNEIILINSDLVGLLKRKSLGLLTDSQEPKRRGGGGGSSVT